ncbi:MAG TPA: alpha/beta hydrolase [Solirubrobacteraceae bacterium]
MEVDPQVRSLIGAQSASGDEPGPADLVALRAGYLAVAIELGGAVEEVEDVDDVVIARADGSSLRARVYAPRVPASPLGAIVWHHGGGWVIGDLEGFDRVARTLCNASGQVVVSVDYRLAPEHPYPAAVEDGEAALRWAAGAGAARMRFDGARVVLGGDSAGGQVAVGAALRAPGLACGQLLVYPALDHEMGSEAYRRNAAAPMLRAEDMAWFWEQYLSGPVAVEPLTDVQLAGLPPAFIAVAGHDPLRDDGLQYGHRLRAAGVRVQSVEFEDMVHGFLRWGGVVDRAQALVRLLGDAARGFTASGANERPATVR